MGVVVCCWFFACLIIFVWGEGVVVFWLGFGVFCCCFLKEGVGGSSFLGGWVGGGGCCHESFSKGRGVQPGLESRLSGCVVLKRY